MLLYRIKTDKKMMNEQNTHKYPKLYICETETGEYFFTTIIAFTL